MWKALNIIKNLTNFRRFFFPAHTTSSITPFSYLFLFLHNELLCVLQNILIETKLNSAFKWNLFSWKSKIARALNDCCMDAHFSDIQITPFEEMSFVWSTRTWGLFRGLKHFSFKKKIPLRLFRGLQFFSHGAKEWCR